MKLFILPAENSLKMRKISDDLKEEKFKILQEAHNHILMRRKRYGNSVIHLGCIFFALFFFYPIILVNVVYFAYSFLWNSPNVLITTERRDTDGNPLEFNNMDEILEKANSVL